ncbi:MAG TPA: HAD family hydrolase [candidate division Zixibacteria bacterium]|nr:HAD family hydrolase [candidate division Zixibacteria bacterium]
MTNRDRWVCLDVGETLIDETRIWSLWADLFGIPRLTFFAALGAVVAGGGQHQGVFDTLGIDEATWRARLPEVEARYGGFREEDLYPDARRALGALAEAGYHVAVAANQPATRTAQLRALGIDPEVLVMSDEVGVHKPDPAFFERVLELMGGPPPSSVAYVGDRVDNDVVPAQQAGLRAVWLRRGPWGLIQQPPEDVRPDLVASSLDELVERIGEVWAGA